MPIPLTEMVEHARDNKHKSCLLKRILPVINWDGSVLTCCNYSYNVMFDNFMNVSLKEIINARYESELCARCQSHAFTATMIKFIMEKIAEYETKMNL